MKFFYKIHNSSFGSKEGDGEFSDREQAKRELQKDGSTLVFLKESKKGKSINEIFDSFSANFGSVSLKEKIMFTRNLSGMLKAGLSLSRAVEVLDKQNKNPKLKKILGSILSSISKGDTLSASLGVFPKVFPSLFVSMVRAGEESGTLSESLSQIGSNLEKIYSLKKKVKSAMMYPVIIMLAIVLIGILMLIFVVPTLTKTFTELGVELPPSTRFILGISDALANNTFLFLGILILVIGLFVRLLKVKSVSRFLDKVILRLPVFGNIARETNSARMSRTLSSLLGSGVSMTRALSITRDVLDNSVYKDKMESAILLVERGGVLSSVFKGDERAFPVMVGEMVEVGEETGNLSSMVSDIADFYESEVDAKLKNLSTIIEPILMIFIGGAVGFFAISMITPMYSLLETID